MGLFMKMRWDWWRNRAMELGVAVLLTTTVIQLSDNITQRQKELLPAAAWFVVNEVYIPDHERGSNPRLIYDRVIHETFNGFWIAEVQRQTPSGLFQNECTGSGVAEYDPEDFIESNEVTWVWFLGKPCAVPPGQYRVKVSYTLTRPGWPQKQTHAISNVFRVLAPSESE